MRRKKAIALLLTASMVFSTHGVAFSAAALDFPENAIHFTKTDLTFSGNLQTQSYNVQSSNGDPLKYGIHYELVSEDNLNQSDAGTYSVELKGLGDYEGKTVSGAWTIGKADMAKVTIEPYTFTYDGTAHELGSYNEDKEDTKISLGEYNLSPDDYTATGNIGTDAGIYKATFTGKGKNFEGKKENVEWEIAAASLAKATVSLDKIEATYTGSTITVTPTVKLDTTLLTLGEDYTATDLSANKVGTYTVKITGIGNYKDSATQTATWEIVNGSEEDEKTSISGATITLVSGNLAYTGSEQTVSIDKVTLGDTELKAGTDYTIISGQSGTNVGTYTLKISGNGAYKDEASKLWYITEADKSDDPVDTKTSISAASIELVSGNLAYTGSKQTVSIDKVILGNTELKAGTDYTIISGQSGTDVGTYTLKISGNGAYKDEASKLWYITEADKQTEIIDKSEKIEAELDEGDLKKAAEADTTIIEMKNANITLEQETAKDLLGEAESGQTVSIVAESEKKDAASVSEDYADIGFVPTTKDVQLFNFSILLGKEEYDFKGKTINVSAKIDVDELVKKGVGKAFAYCVSSDQAKEKDIPLPEYSGKNATDAEYMDMELSHQSTYAFTGELDAAGKVNVIFKSDAYIEGDDGYKSADGNVTFIDDSSAKELTLTTNAGSGFKVTAPYAVRSRYSTVKWISESDMSNNTENDPSAAPGATLQLNSERYTADETYVETYYPVVKKLDTVSPVPLSANGHKIVIEVNSTPAFAGRKLKGIDLVESITIDGKSVDKSLAKIKTKGRKNVGSVVTVTLQSIKGLDKDTNKALKGQSLGTATIRAIQATETTLWNKTFDHEGQMIVSFKNGNPKKIMAIVPKGWKFNKKNGRPQQTAKKIRIKKGFTYDSATGYLTFDGTTVDGIIKVDITSK